jgi:hypothetical protein
MRTLGPLGRVAAIPDQRMAGRRMVIRALACVVVMGGVVAPTASAQFISNTNLPPQTVYSTTANAHYIDRTEGQSNHTFCPAWTQGASGWSQSWSSIDYRNCAPGFTAVNWSGQILARGAVWNPNQSTTDYMYSAYWNWH